MVGAGVGIGQLGFEGCRLGRSWKKLGLSLSMTFCGQSCSSEIRWLSEICSEKLCSPELFGLSSIALPGATDCPWIHGSGSYHSWSR